MQSTDTGGIPQRGWLMPGDPAPQQMALVDHNGQVMQREAPFSPTGAAMQASGSNSVVQHAQLQLPRQVTAEAVPAELMHEAATSEVVHDVSTIVELPGQLPVDGEGHAATLQYIPTRLTVMGRRLSESHLPEGRRIMQPLNTMPLRRCMAHPREPLVTYVTRLLTVADLSERVFPEYVVLESHVCSMLCKSLEIIQPGLTEMTRRVLGVDWCLRHHLFLEDLVQAVHDAIALLGMEAPEPVPEPANSDGGGEFGSDSACIVSLLQLLVLPRDE
jgi:hypothetical protein